MKRSAVALAALTFTDANAPSVVGLTPRQLRAFVRKHRVPHAKIGRRVVVRVDRFLEALDSLSGAKPRPAWNEDNIIALAARGA